MMARSLRPRLRLALAALSLALQPALAGTFGKVIALGGHASDLALDEPRGVLYVANFTANRIEVLSLSDLTVRRSMNVGPQPGAIALSPDGRYLVVAHFGNFQAPASAANALTAIDLNAGSRQTFSLGSPPLGVAFGATAKALVVTSTEFLEFDPSTGTTRVISTVGDITAATLPQPSATPPAQIVATALGVSGNGVYIYGATDSVLFRYDTVREALSGATYSATPSLGPRAVSVNRDGTAWMAGWTLRATNFYALGGFSNVTGALGVGTVQFDSRRNLVYAQMGVVPNSTAAAGATGPELWVADADNLAVKERLKLQENLAGRSLMSADGSTMFSISESGVTVLPVGHLDQTPRIVVSTPDLLFRAGGCDRTAIAQELRIVSEGALADFTVSSDNPGVRVSPSRGVTPATVRITVDPTVFAAQKGTVPVPLRISSAIAVNAVEPVRVLVNTKEPDQKGTIVNIPGTLVDLVADPGRDRFFVLRQNTNEVLVFNASNFTQTHALKTFTKPMSMAVTFDRRWLLVGNDNSHFINVFDLETLEADRPILAPDYVQSIAASAGAILATTRSASGGDNKVHRVDMTTRQTRALDTLGVFENKIAANSVAVASGNGRSILIAQPDGTLMLYDSAQDAFTISRKESTPLLGTYAASNFDKFVVGSALLNASLVPERRLDTSAGQTSGFAFLDRDLGFRIGAPSASAPGVLARVELAGGGIVRPTRTVEAPLLSGTERPFTRTLAWMHNRSALVALTNSGLTVFPWEYDAATAPPRIEKVVNAADFTEPVAPGGLIAITGADLSPVSQASRTTPLPTALADTCLTVNGMPVPMILASPDRINAQLPFAVEGNTTLVLRTPGGVSDNFNLMVQTAAPSIFRNVRVGPSDEAAAVIRNANGQPATLSNPVRHGDMLSIFATGLGVTSPAVEAGAAAPRQPLATAVIQPAVSIGGVPVEVLYAGLVPDEVGVYQINVRVNGQVPEGMNVPLQIRQGAANTAVSVRVVD